MHSFLSEIKEIPNLLPDSAIPAKMVQIYGFIYKENEVFSLIIFDPLGGIINAVEMQAVEAMKEINFKPNTLAFCDIIMYDVFTDHTILGTIELDGPVDDVLTREIKNDKRFIKNLYDELMEAFVNPKPVLI